MRYEYRAVITKSSSSTEIFNVGWVGFDDAGKPQHWEHPWHHLIDNDPSVIAGALLLMGKALERSLPIDARNGELVEMPELLKL